MAQPTPYNPLTDYQDLEANDPALSGIGPDIDADLAAIALTFSQVLANLLLIQRDDGALANGIVTTQSLAPSVLASLGIAQVWATGEVFAVGDVTFVNNAIYQCAIANTASASFATDLAAGKWTLIIDYGATVFMSASATSFTPAIQSKIFTVLAGKQFVPGFYVKGLSAADPINTQWSGMVTAYSGTQLTVNVSYAIGAGAHTDWSIYTSGDPGPTGSAGTLDFSALTEDTSPDGAADYLVTRDTSASANKKVLISNFFKTIGSLTALTSVSPTTDAIPMYDNTASAARKATVGNILGALNALTQKTVPLPADQVLIYDTIAAASAQSTIAQILAAVNGLAAKTVPVPSADYALIYDAAGGAAKKAPLSALGAIPVGLKCGLQLQYQNSNGIYINSGACADVTGSIVINNLSSITVSKNVLGAGGIDSGTASSSSWYHVYLIYGASGINGLLSLQPAAPTVPAGYTYYRRIGAIKLDASSNVTQFVHIVEFDTFYWSTPYVEFANYTLTTSVRNNLGLQSTPPGIRVKPLIRMNTTTASSFIIVCSKDEPDIAPSGTQNYTSSNGYDLNNGVFGTVVSPHLTTDTSAAIAARPTTAAVINLINRGYIDTCGRNG